MRRNDLSVEVKAGYRLHLGFYRFYDPPYAYGAIGVAVNEPSFSVVVRGSDSGLRINAPTEGCRDVIARVVKLLGLSDVEVLFNGFIAHNVGLGSRTRVTLATSTALATYFRRELELPDVMKLLSGRKISAVGLYTYLYGNLVVDSGFRVDSGEGGEVLPKLVGVYEVPSNWYVIIALPEGLKGLSEGEEGEILQKVSEHPRQEALYREFVKLITSINLRDFNTFTQSLSSLQNLTGEYFSKYQGGVFSHWISEELVNVMRGEGARGVGQSSWGPTVYGFVNDYVKALSIRSAVLSYADRKGYRVLCWVTNASRIGHQVIISSR